MVKVNVHCIKQNKNVSYFKRYSSNTVLTQLKMFNYEEKVEESSVTLDLST